jgi:hypothetical protein
MVINVSLNALMFSGVSLRVRLTAEFDFEIGAGWLSTLLGVMIIVFVLVFDRLLVSVFASCFSVVFVYFSSKLGSVISKRQKRGVALLALSQKPFQLAVADPDVVLPVRDQSKSVGVDACVALLVDILGAAPVPGNGSHPWEPIVVVRALPQRADAAGPPADVELFILQIVE